MRSHTHKTQENKNPSLENRFARKQTAPQPTFSFEDNRPEAIAQRELQELANNSPRAKQFNALQELANNSPQAKQAAQLQAMADNYSVQQHQPVQNKENKTALPDNLKSGIEKLSGYSMEDVKVHYNSDKPVQLQAHAYAQGTDIHVAAGQEKHLPHEAWHVVQQKQGRVRATMQMKENVNINDDLGLEKEADVMGTKALKMPQTTGKSNSSHPQTDFYSAKWLSIGPQTPIQRAVGFEFETKDVLTKRLNTPLPQDGFVDVKTAENTFNTPAATKIKKGDALLQKPDVEVQADDHRKLYSDLEVVTNHFPFTDNGRVRLEQAMTDVMTLVTNYSRVGMPSGHIVPAVALDNIAGFKTVMNDGMFLGKWHEAKTAGQVTMGSHLSNIGDIVYDLHDDTSESPVEAAARNPGRLHMRDATPSTSEPQALTESSEAKTLINGHQLAKSTLATYKARNTSAPVGEALEGFLTIIFTYCEGMGRKMAFLKSHTPLMAKTDLATIFTTLPTNVQTYYSKKNLLGQSNLVALIRTASGYATKMEQPLFLNVKGLLDDDHDRGQPQWYHKLKLSKWLNDITPFKRRPGTDLLTNATFPNKPGNQIVEGYGALGTKIDEEIGPSARLPIFELRSATKRILFSEAGAWALDFFDYARSLFSNPGRHNRMR